MNEVTALTGALSRAFSMESIAFARSFLTWS